MRRHLGPHGCNDPENPNSLEARLRGWGADRTLSGDIITEQNIHALDVATWILDAAPICAPTAPADARARLCPMAFGTIFR